MNNTTLLVLWKLYGSAGEYALKGNDSLYNDFEFEQIKRVEACDVIEWGSFDLELDQPSYPAWLLNKMLYNALFDKIIRQA